MSSRVASQHDLLEILTADYDWDAPLRPIRLGTESDHLLVNETYLLRLELCNTV
jgi:hypothetical protein